MKELIQRTYWSLVAYLGLSSRIKTPTILQMEAAECGSASLNIALSYYKKFIPAAELRYQCGVSRNGADAYNISEAAKFYGLDGIGYKAATEDLQTKVQSPAILWWAYNHFVVLEGFVGETVYINDPAKGPDHMPLDEFNEKYSGVVITCNPTEDFYPGGEKPPFFRPLVKRLEKLKTIVAVFVCLQLLLVVVGIAQAIFGQVFIDHFFYGKIPTWASTFFWGFLLLNVINIFAIWIQGYILNRTGVKIATSLSTRYLWHVLRLPIAFFEQRFGGEIIRRIGINTRVSSTVTGELAGLIVNTVVVFLYSIVVYQYDRLMAVAAVAIVGLQLFMILLLNRLRMNAYARTQQDSAILSGITIDTIMNMETHSLYGSDQFGFQRVMNAFIKILNRFQVIGKMDVFLGSSSQFLTQLSSIAVLAIGGWRVMFGALTVGMFVTLQVLVGRMVAPLQRLASVALLVPTLKMDLARLEDVLENPIDPLIQRSEGMGTEKAVTFSPFHDEIDIQQIIFGYTPHDDPLFNNLSLTIKAGSTLGITGPNGSGKTTLTKIISAMHKPWTGQVLFDGQNMAVEDPNWIQQNIATVYNESLFVEGTVKENLTLWDPSFEEDAIRSACTLACIDDVLENRVDKYLYRMNERASDFSEGQKQRLALARALLFKPKILILDESLSNLDRDLQQKIMHNISKLNLTLIVISHRIHILQHCDRIVVLESGQVCQDGAVDMLIKEVGFFQNQFADEYKLLDWEI